MPESNVYDHFSNEKKEFVSSLCCFSIEDICDHLLWLQYMNTDPIFTTLMLHPCYCYVPQRIENDQQLFSVTPCLLYTL